MLSSPTFKEQNAHIASVKNILESHASYLMSGKELSKLVAFVKGTQFDLVVRRKCQCFKPSWVFSFLILWCSRFNCKLIVGISSTRTIPECSVGKFCFGIWINWSEGIDICEISSWCPLEFQLLSCFLIWLFFSFSVGKMYTQWAMMHRHFLNKNKRREM